jgi:hypothetical protein
MLDKSNIFPINWERSKQQHNSDTPEFAMTTNFYTYLQGCMDKRTQGWGKKALVALLGALLGLAVLSPATAKAAVNGGGITQLEFLKWMSQVTGDKDQFNANSSAQDYVNWAKVKGMNPSSGWQPNATLQRDMLAQILVQLFNLNPKKYGGDFVRILAREGIELPNENEISRRGLVSLINEFSFMEPLKQHHGHSPFKHPNNGKGNGDQPPPPHNPNGNPQDGDHGHNGGHNKDKDKD